MFCAATVRMRGYPTNVGAHLPALFGFGDPRFEAGARGKERLTSGSVNEVLAYVIVGVGREIRWNWPFSAERQSCDARSSAGNKRALT